MQATPILAFQQWKEAQNALDHAMRHYLESTMALHSSLYSPLHTAESFSVRNSLAETWPNDSPVPDKHSVLSRAQVHLSQMRNSMLPINSLPLELLLKIFRLAAFCSLHLQDDTPVPNLAQQHDYKDLLVLTHVCSYWRTALLDTPYFWSRFELDTRNSVGEESQRAEMYLDRARGASQYLFIEERSNYYFRNADFDGVLKLIGSRLENLTQLALLNFPDIQYVTQAISHWLKLGKPGVLRTLTIQMETQIQLHESIPTEYTDFAEQALSMLASVHSLALRGVKFDWNNPVYHNLVQLHISNIPYESSPHTHHILGVLSASPLLRTLKISDMAVLRCDQVPSEPVYLTELEHLELTGLTYESLDVFLPMVFPQSKDLSIRITLLSLEDNLVSAVQSFLNRTNVTRLFLRQDLIARCLPIIPNLRALVIDLDEQPGDSCLSEFSYIDASNARRMLRYPKLDTLHLHSGSIPIEAIQAVIETHPLVQKLRFSACYIEPFEDELSYWLKPYVEDVQFTLRLDEATIFDWCRLMV
ncbi:hypothetical protein FRC11_005631 [Ceratobasidium sp. 423]|nr:hypothetical protein FRC11_005631 [Ceratobasidium sp. 423]